MLSIMTFYVNFLLCLPMAINGMVRKLNALAKSNETPIVHLRPLRGQLINTLAKNIAGMSTRFKRKEFK